MAPARHSPRAPTSRHLADKILQSKSALEGERKQVTVLFADVKGSMELAEQLDPEEWHAIMQRFFAILAEGVQRFEGFVNQYTGDGIMALFGAPIAHEDHAQRACYAALHLRDELARYADEVKREHGARLLGAHGPQLGRGGRRQDRRRSAHGLHGAGPHRRPGAAHGGARRAGHLLPDAAHGRAGRAATSRSTISATFRVKGVARAGARPPARAASGAARTRFDVSRAPRPLALRRPRRRDARRSRRRSSRRRAGNGQVVGVVAEAGTGKSRLCFEFARALPRRAACASTRAAPSRTARTSRYLPILEVFRAYYGITEQDDDRTAREKIAGRLLLLDEGFREALPVLFDFLGVPDPERPVPRMDPEARSASSSACCASSSRARAQAQPAVTLIEDLHWIDAASEAFLEHMVDARRPARRSLLLVNFRPEYRADVDAEVVLPAAPAGAARPARRSASCSPTCSAATRASRGLADGDPRAHRRQPVLHRGGGADR